ncbi:MAG: RNA polymerase sigma factor (sigma-70 family) [Gammaproteobacteria bacterium]|jgi:RNA polymerase sigma-70 factor (ECF subfamily)
MQKNGLRASGRRCCSKYFFTPAFISKVGSHQGAEGFSDHNASRLIIDEARRKKVEQRYLKTYYYYHGEESVVPSTEDVVLMTETLTALIQMLEGLPEKCLRAFLMNRLDGMKHAEIAETLGVSKSMVKQYMARAMLY